MARDENAHQQDEKEESKVADTIIISTRVAPKHRVHIDRDALEIEFKEIFETDDEKATVVIGNYQVGKSDIVDTVFAKLGGGVAFILLQNLNVTLEAAVLTKSGVSSLEEAEGAMSLAAKRLFRKPVVIVDIPRDQTDQAVLRSASAFCRGWACPSLLRRW